MSLVKAGFVPPDETIKIAPQDWYYATWRRLPPLPRPQPRLFSWAKMAHRYFEDELLVWSRIDYLNPSLATAALSHTEAHFWLRVILTTIKQKPSDRVPDLSLTQAQQTVSFEEAQQKLRNKVLVANQLNGSLANILLAAFSAAEAIELTCAANWSYSGDVFHQQLLPYLSETEREILRQIVRQYLLEDQTLASLDRLHQIRFMPVGVWLAGALEMTDVLKEVLAYWKRSPSRRYGWFGSEPQMLLFGLGDPQQMVNEMKQLRLYLQTPQQVRAWLAHTERTQLHFIMDSLREASPRAVPSLLKAFLLAEHPNTAAYLVELLNDKPSAALLEERVTVRQWLDQRPELALEGLVPLVNQYDEVGTAARDHVQRLVNQNPALLETFMQLGDAAGWRPTLPVARPYDDSNIPAWWREAPRPMARHERTRPQWLAATDLPELVLADGFRLNEQQVNHLLETVLNGYLEPMPPLVAAVREQALPSSLTNFTVQLMTLWRRHRADWYVTQPLLNVLVWWYTDDLPARVAPLVIDLTRADRRQQREIEMFLHILALWKELATDEILQLFGRIKCEDRLGGLYQDMLNVIDYCMKKRQLDRSQLNDLLIPTFGLDEKSERIFPYRQQEVVLRVNEDLQLELAWAHNVYDGVPEEITADTSSLEAQQVVAHWEMIEAQLPKALNHELWRLDRALVYERRWDWQSFTELFLRHPLMRHLGRSMIWGRYAFNGELTHSFVFVEDGTPLNYEYDEVEMPTYGSYGVVHPIDLRAETRLAWHNMLVDYEIVTLFDQLFRPVYQLTAAEKNSLMLTRHSGVYHPDAVYRLRQLHWKSLDEYDTWRRWFPYSNVSALITFRYGRAADGTLRKEFEACRFAYGRVEIDRPYPAKHIAQLPLQWIRPRRVRPRIISEVLWDWAKAAGEADFE
ncbi:MAG: DUF4132 domain-containing protein [Anaerolineales bacterium]|nr:DUF4132 domain-containing protein [Anaerolineales bacterium]